MLTTSCLLSKSTHVAGSSPSHVNSSRAATRLHTYKITDSGGDPVGSIDGAFAPYEFERYELTLTAMSSVPTAAMVIGAIVIDGVQTA